MSTLLLLYLTQVFTKKQKMKTNIVNTYSGDQFTCSYDARWTDFREIMIENHGQGYPPSPQILKISHEYLGMMDAIYGGNQHFSIPVVAFFYDNLCATDDTLLRAYEEEVDFLPCAYGIAMAFFARARNHTFIQDFAWAHEDFHTALTILGKSQCLDFTESSPWPLRYNDILVNLKTVNGDPPKEFRLAEIVAQDIKKRMNTTIFGEKNLKRREADLKKKFNRSVEHHRVAVFGTHVTLTREILLQYKKFVSKRFDHKTYGAYYRCKALDSCSEDWVTKNLENNTLIQGNLTHLEMTEREKKIMEE